MNSQAIIHARRVAREIRARKMQQAWLDAPKASLARVAPVNRPRRILRPIY